MNNPTPSRTCGCTGSHACDCCTGPRVLTPTPIENPPGQSVLRRRAGDWDTFRRTMQALLSDTVHFPALQNLTTREQDDPSIAFLDAAAVVGDVLTFYNERFTQEGYLRTATERRSLVELGKLVGYTPRPGVAASTWLAFTLDAGYNITIPAGTRVQSVPGTPDEKAQTFETSADLNARAELNAMPARQSIPQEISPANVINLETVWFQGIGLSLRPGDMLLFVFPEDEASNTPRRIHTVAEDAEAKRTMVKLEVEKLSAAFQVPVLRKAAEALRQSIPDAWRTDEKKWAKEAVIALEAAIPQMGSDTSLLNLEKLFLPPTGSDATTDKNLDARLQAVVDAGDKAQNFKDGLEQRAAWETDLSTKWKALLDRAVVQEGLLEDVFAQLKEIDANSGAAKLENRKAAAAAIAKLLAENQDSGSGRIKQCFPSVAKVLGALRDAAAQASLVSNETEWDKIALGPTKGTVRKDADALGLKGTAEETARVDGVQVLISAKLKLEQTPAKTADAVNLLLDDTDSNSLERKINAAGATTPVGILLAEIKKDLDKEWKSLRDDLMYQRLDASAMEDKFLKDLAAENANHVKLLPTLPTVTQESLVAPLQKLAEQSAVLLQGDETPVKIPDARPDLQKIAEIGSRSKTLTAHRARFREESLQGFRRAIQLLTGRYKKDLQAHTDVGPALTTLQSAATASPQKETLADLRGKLITALDVVKPALEKEQNPTTRQLLNRLRAEMEILDSQVSSSPSGASTAAKVSESAAGASLGKIIGGSTLQQPGAPGDPLAISRSLGAFASTTGGAGGVASDAVSRLAGRLAGSTDDELFAAWRLLNTGTPSVDVYVLRVTTAVFGNSAPMRFGTGADQSFDARFVNPIGSGDWAVAAGDLGGSIRLEGEQNKVVRDSYLVIERPMTVELTDANGRKSNSEALYVRVRRVEDAVIAPHSAYSLSGKATTVKLLGDEAWGSGDPLEFKIIRRARVYAASERLTLAELPVERVVGKEPKKAAAVIERDSENPFSESREVLMLDRLYQGIEAGHRIMLAGERSDDISVRPVREYALVAKVEHALIPAMSKPDSPLPGDTPHTRLILSAPLQYQYKRSTLVVYGNVAEATHGETKREVLGSGNPQVASQRFPLRSLPVTHVAAATETGAESTVVLRVDGIEWHAVPQFTNAGANDRVFMLEIVDDGATTAVFGDGARGARLPAGTENVKAVYRSGLGKEGNVRPESLTTLLDRPLGLKEVKNPLAASGGAGVDSAEQIRRNAPLPLLALDRLVSVSDYAAFSRAFAGIGKAESALIGGGASGAFVHVTIAGQDDAPIAEMSALMTSLTGALIALGDPLVPVRVQSRELLVLMLAAKVRVAPDFAWADVEPAVRAAVLAAFGFARREPGQDVFLSEVIAAMHAVPGVDFVDVDSFGGVPEKQSTDKERTALPPEELEARIKAIITDAPMPRVAAELAGYDEHNHLRPAQLAIFLADMPETLILNQLVP